MPLTETEVKIRLLRPATGGEMFALLQHLRMSIITRAYLKRTQPETPALDDLAVLGVALSRWLDANPSTIIAALVEEA